VADGEFGCSSFKTPLEVAGHTEVVAMPPNRTKVFNLDDLRLLDEFSRSFPQGRLRPEAVILRLAALLAAGRQQAADSLASQLLSDEAYVSYVPRIQSLLREVKP